MIETITLPNLDEVWQETMNWKPNDRQKELFNGLYREILIGNQETNLTRITEKQDFWEKHLWDSLIVFKNIETIAGKNPKIKAIDIGTGAGFPGIPVAIAHPSWKVKLLDATRKKIYFLQSLIEKLGLKNLKTLIGRVEEIGREKIHREAYNIALIRAVGKPSVCAEYALPLLEIGGFAILYRGNWSVEETDSLNVVVSQLGGKIALVEAFETPLTNSIRHCIYLEKISSTPSKFPRGVGIPSHQPL